MSRIIFPLDVSNIGDAEYFVKNLKEHVAIFKIGLELFYKAGASWVKDIVEKENIKIFLDMKLHDIPNTVLGAVKNLLDLEPFFITVHLDEAKRFREIVYNNTGFKGFLCVSFLTSLGRSDLHNLYVNKNITVTDYVLKKAEIALEAGCRGIVCAATEVKRIKEKFGDSLIVVTPGIRLRDASVAGDDQKRVVTPYEAVINGSDYIVVGRPIRNADNPIEVCNQINAEVDKALKLKN